MRHVRFNVASLLGVILVIGVSFAALRESTELWESGVFTLTLAALLISSLLAVHRAGKRPAFWLGFAVFGWFYLALTVVPSIESKLITTQACGYLDSKVPRRAPKVFAYLLSDIPSRAPSTKAPNLALTGVGTQFVTSNQGQLRLWDTTTGKLLGGWSGTTENFVRIGHSLFALLAGWLGGQLSCRFYRSSRLAVQSMAVDAKGTGS
jgi:hypothetical protein